MWQLVNQLPFLLFWALLLALPLWLVWKFYQVLLSIAESLAGIRQTLQERPRT
jgi:hypothetical protein